MADSPGRDNPHLLVTNGPFEGTLLPFGGSQGEQLLGSGPECQLRLQLTDVALIHARLVWNERGVFVHDAGSQHGTYVNGERVDDVCPVSDGDRINLGTPGSPGAARLLVRLPGPPANYPAPDAAPAAGAADDLLQYGTEEEVEEREAAVRAAKPAVPRQPSADDFLTQPVMIGGPRPASARARIAPRPLPQKPSASRMVVVAGVAAALAAGGFLLFSRSQASGPVLLSLTPPKAEPGQTILVAGSGFDPSPGANTVTFGDQAASVTSATDTQLSVVVPAGLPVEEKRQHPVRVTTRGRTSSVLFFKVYVGPKVSALTPDVALPGDLVRVTGESLAGVSEVTVGGMPAEVSDLEAGSLSFRVPPLDTSPARWVQVQVQAGETSARLTHLLLGRLPLALEVAPSRGLPGDRVRIKGRGFDPEPLRNTVRFGDRPALLLSSSDSEAVAVVPLAGPLSGQTELEISVTTLGATSRGPARFTLARPSAAAFIPRFVAEPDTSPERVVVATELGPVLRLAGPAAALSTAERGAAAADALNRLMQTAARTPPRLEVRLAPSLCVAVAGTPIVLVSVTPEDAAAYTEGARPSAAFLARYWAALLEDYVGLFVQRQRPYRVLDLGSRASALVDIFAQSERRAGEGAGVPLALVAGLTPAVRRELVEMAFVLPAEGSGGGAAAVVGRWEGTLEIPGRAAQGFQVRIRGAGRGLEGTLTTRSGAIAGELALEGLRYEKGTLSFGVSLGGTLLRFSGRLDGSVVSGGVERADRQPGGRFTMKWLE